MTAFDWLKIVLPPILFIVVVAVGVPYVKSRPTIYQSTARIWIQAQFPSYGTEQSGSSSGLYLPLSSFFNSPIKTAAELVRSDAVLQEAVAQLQKSLPAEQCPSIDELRSGLKTEEVKDTDVLGLRFTGREPKMACVALNGVLDGFIKLNSMQSSANAVRSREFLEEQVVKAKGRLNEARNKLQQFQAKHGKPDMDRETTDSLDKILHIEADLAESHTELARQREIVVSLEGITQEPVKDDLSAVMIADPVIKQLQERKNQLDLQIVQLAPRLRDTHPLMRSLKEALVDTDRALNERKDAYRAGKIKFDSLPAAQTTHLDKRDYLADSRREIAGLEGKIRSQSRALFEAKARLKDLPQQQVAYAELRHGEEQALNALSDFEKRLDNARMVESVSSGVTNIQIIDRPAVSADPQGPSSAILMAAAALLGFVTAIAAYFGVGLLDPFISKPKDLQLGRFLYLATLGKLKGTGYIDATVFNRLRLLLIPGLQDRKIIAVTSATVSDGKTTCALGLAKAFAESGSRVVFVQDAVRAPLIHQQRDLAVRMLDGSVTSCDSLDELLPYMAMLDKDVTLVCNNPESPLAWDSKPGSKLLDILQAEFDLVVVDCDAVSRSGRVLSLCSKALPLVVIRLKHTLKQEMLMLARQFELQQVGGINAVVWNAQESFLSGVSTGLPTQSPTAGKAVATPQEDDLWA